jgi:uncharacterized membrane protein YfcA
MSAVMGLMVAGGHASWLAAAPLVYEVVNNLVAIKSLRRRSFGYNPHWRFHAKLIAATILGWICADFVASTIGTPALQIFAAGLAAFVGFLGVMLLLRAFDSGDVHTLKELLRREKEQ